MPERMQLSEASAQEARRAQRTAGPGFLEPGRTPANVIGLGVGVKWRRGEPTGEPAVLVLVTKKVAKSELRPTDLAPARIGGVQTDVLAVGTPAAGVDAIPKVGAQLVAARARPAMGGYSVGHPDVTAGTIASCAYPVLPGGSAALARNGLGIPSTTYLLSNNHILAHSNKARLGDPILQPGALDGGRDPSDRIGTLRRFVPIAFDPPVPRSRHRNLVDAAIAEVAPTEASREIYWCGYLRGWRRKAEVGVGTLVKKTGRTTHFTTGRITATDVTIDILYDGGRTARFKDQFVTTAFSKGGDSGSLIMTFDNVAVGLLFAGSTIATVANQIEHVRSLLEVEVAEATA